MPVVTLSRMLGTTGDAIAEGVAQALGGRLVTKATLYAAAQAAGISPVALADLDGATAMSLADRLIAAVRSMPMLPRSRGASLLDASPLPVAHEGFLPETPTQYELDESARLLDRVIRDLAATGNLVIVGRAAHAILRERGDALCVQIVAPIEYRIQALAQGENITVREALARIRASDRTRADYVRRYYNIGWTDSAQFDLVLNAARLPVPVAVKLIVSALPPAR